MSNPNVRLALSMIVLLRTAVQGDDAPDPANIQARIPSMKWFARLESNLLPQGLLHPTDPSI